MSLEQILKDRYGLKDEDLSKALNLRKDLGGDIGQILVQTGLIKESQLTEAFSHYLNIPLFEGEWTEEEMLVAYLAENLNYDFLIKNNFLPVKIDHVAKTLHGITDNPFNYKVFDYVLRSLGYTVQLSLATATEQTIKELSRDYLHEGGKNFVSLDVEEDTEKLKEMAFEAPGHQVPQRPPEQRGRTQGFGHPYRSLGKNTRLDSGLTVSSVTWTPLKNQILSGNGIENKTSCRSRHRRKEITPGR